MTVEAFAFNAKFISFRATTVTAVPITSTIVVVVVAIAVAYILG